MDTSIHILVLARPGHFRDSLCALLKTLPQTELFLAAPEKSADLQRLAGKTPDLVVVDLDADGDASARSVSALREACGGVRCLALVNNSRQAQQAQQVLNADLVLSKSTSAGDFLAAVRQLSRRSGRGVAARKGGGAAFSYLYALDR